MLCSQNFQKQTLKKFHTGGGAPNAPTLDPPLLGVNLIQTYIHV